MATVDVDTDYRVAQKSDNSSYDVT